MNSRYTAGAMAQMVTDKQRIEELEARLAHNARWGIANIVASLILLLILIVQRYL